MSQVGLIGNPMIYRQLPLEDAIARTLSGGFDALELWPPQIAECATPALRRALASSIRDAGAEPVRLNCADRPYFQALARDEDVAIALQGLKQDIQAAADLGTTAASTPGVNQGCCP